MQKNKKNTSPTVYWPEELDQYIDKYNKSTDGVERTYIFNTFLHFPLDKLSESIINKFKFLYLNEGYEETKADLIGFLLITLEKYDITKGTKSFSYFSVIAKNYLIYNNTKGYSQEKRMLYLSDASSDGTTSIDDIMNVEAPSTAYSEDMKDFIELMVIYWDANIQRVFKKKRDIEIASAIIHLFKHVDKIENFNKKALYLMIREMADYRATYITKVIKKMKTQVVRQRNQFQSEGEILSDEHKFFTYSKK